MHVRYNRHELIILSFVYLCVCVCFFGAVHVKDRCRLYCRVEHSSAYYLLKDKVADGTPCGPDTDDICVNGICKQASCNHVLGRKEQLGTSFLSIYLSFFLSFLIYPLLPPSLLLTPLTPSICFPVLCLLVHRWRNTDGAAWRLLVGYSGSLLSSHALVSCDKESGAYQSFHWPASTSRRVALIKQ